MVCTDDKPSEAVDPQTLPAAYLNLFPTPMRKNSHPYVTGKMIVVEKSETGGGQTLIPGTFESGMQYWVKDDQLIAETSGSTDHVVHPEEVGTVVWLECREAYVGTYTDGTKGYETDCMVTVIDKAKNLIVGKKLISDSPPDFLTRCKTAPCAPYYAGLDEDALAEYLEGLPRKPIS